MRSSFVPVACHVDALKEFHHSPFVVHLGGMKDSKRFALHHQYWRKGLIEPMLRLLIVIELSANKDRAPENRKVGFYNYFQLLSKCRSYCHGPCYRIFERFDKVAPSLSIKVIDTTNLFHVIYLREIMRLQRGHMNSARP